MSKPVYKPMSEDLCYKSFSQYEKQVDRDYKAGLLTLEQARSCLTLSKKNYRNQTYNRQIENING